MEIHFFMKSMRVVSLYNTQGECGFMQKENYTNQTRGEKSATFLYFYSDSECQSWKVKKEEENNGGSENE